MTSARNWTDGSTEEPVEEENKVNSTRTTTGINSRKPQTSGNINGGDGSEEEDIEYITSDFRPSSHIRRPLDGNGSKKEFIMNAFRSITIEPMVFLQMISLTCTSVILQNFYIERVCQIDFNQTKSFCANLTENPDLDHGLGNTKTKK